MERLGSPFAEMLTVRFCVLALCLAVEAARNVPLATISMFSRMCPFAVSWPIEVSIVFGEYRLLRFANSPLLTECQTCPGYNFGLVADEGVIDAVLRNMELTNANILSDRTVVRAVGGTSRSYAVDVQLFPVERGEIRIRLPYDTAVDLLGEPNTEVIFRAHYGTKT